MNPMRPFGFLMKTEINRNKSFADDEKQIPMKKALLNNFKNGLLVNCIMIMTINAICINIKASSVHSGKNSKTLDKSKKNDDIVTRLTYTLWLKAVKGDNEKYAEHPMIEDI